MNRVDPGNSRPPEQELRRRPPQGNASNRAKNRKKMKKRAKNMLPIIVLGVGGVVMIALLIMGLKALFSAAAPKVEEGTTSSAVSATPTPEPTPMVTPVPVAAKEADVTDAQVLAYGDMMLVGDAAYDYYKFDLEKADRFVAAVNQSAAGLGAGVTVYSMLIPGATDVMLPLSFLNMQAEVTSDQEKAIRYLNKGMSGMTHVSLYPVLKAHCNEKIYFKSDNHWTSLGAYYAYSEWAYQKGITADVLSDYKKDSFGGFLGNQYSFTEHSAISTPEEVEVYSPKANIVIETTQEGEPTQSPWLLDVSEYPQNEKYKAFLGGSKGLTKLVNLDSTAESACILVGDVNGTALAPYIAQHYKTTYFVDYTQYDGTLSSLLSESGATDVVYAISLSASISDDATQALAGL